MEGPKVGISEILGHYYDHEKTRANYAASSKGFALALGDAIE
jgi:hypothetical protein